MNNFDPRKTAQLTLHSMGAALIAGSVCAPLALAAPLPTTPHQAAATAEVEPTPAVPTTRPGTTAKMPATGHQKNALQPPAQPAPVPTTPHQAGATTEIMPTDAAATARPQTAERMPVTAHQEDALRPLNGAQPSADEVVARMKAALAPSGTIVGTADVYAERDGEIVVQHGLRIARGVVDGKVCTSIAFSDPSPYAGTAMMWGLQTDEGQATEAIYLPSERRVREIELVNPEEKLLRTDFTRANLFVTPPRAQRHRLMGEDTAMGRKSYRIESKPVEPLYFSRTVTWVAADTWLPVRREYYDRAGRLWKIAVYSGLLMGGDAVLTSISLDDVQSNTRSFLNVRGVNHLKGDGRALFEVSKLGRLTDHSAWDGLAQN